MSELIAKLEKLDSRVEELSKSAKQLRDESAQERKELRLIVIYLAALATGGAGDVLKRLLGW